MDLHGVLRPGTRGMRDGARVVLPQLPGLHDRGLTRDAVHLSGVKYIQILIFCRKGRIILLTQALTRRLRGLVFGLRCGMF